LWKHHQGEPMSDVSELMQRIDGAIASATEKAKQQQQALLHDLAERQKRLAAYEKDRAKVREIAKPRLEAFAKRFGDRVKVTPRVTETTNSATFDFKSPEAVIALTFSVAPDPNVQNFVVQYDLKLVPVLMKYQSHAEVTFPIGALNTAALEKWLDDQIIAFVELYIQIHEGEIYKRAEYVEDPIANVKFPKFAAAGSLDHGGKTYYFIDERTRGEFAKQKGIATT
jgi:YHS domain-containing protein